MTLSGGRVVDEAFVTLATNDKYCYGALVLGQCLRDVATTRQLAILITPMVTSFMRQQLFEIYDYIQEVNPLDSQDDANLALLARPDLGITFSKLHCWRLKQFTKCVFLDADCLILRNVDDLFDRDEFSAAADVGWPDCFNSGVFVFKPSDETYAALLQCAVTHGSFDGGDQGLLNTFFSDWSTKDINRHLPFVYNMTSSSSYSYKPAFVKFGKDVRIVHFIGATKPWSFTYDIETGRLYHQHDRTTQHDSEFIKAWWNVFVTQIIPKIEKAKGFELASEIGQINLNDKGDETEEQVYVSSNQTRRQAWEKGDIDYMGEDRFSNIMHHIENTLKSTENP